MAFGVWKKFAKGLCKSHIAVKRMMSSQSSYQFETLAISQPKEFVFQVEMNRPKIANALNKIMWREIEECFNKLAEDEDCRSVVLCGAGKHFCAGIDFGDLASIVAADESTVDVARRAFKLRHLIKTFQDTFSAIEKCSKPVIAAIHNCCIGGAVDMISACDIRYCTNEAYFQIKEVELGLAADVGTLQRFPKIIGNDSLFRELAFSARVFRSNEAKEIGFISRIFEDHASLLAGALDMASLIASKSPVAVQGTKIAVNYSRDHSTEEGLNFMTTWNMTMLQSEDLIKAATAVANKSSCVTFAKL